MLTMGFGFPDSFSTFVVFGDPVAQLSFQNILGIGLWRKTSETISKILEGNHRKSSSTFDNGICEV